MMPEMQRASQVRCEGCRERSRTLPHADFSFNTVNVNGHDRVATIVFQDGRELEARNITASPDSTRFLIV